MRIIKTLRLPDRRGLTLVEMMISLTIFAIVLGVAFSFMSNSQRSYNNTRERVQYQQSVRAVMSLVTRELRSVGCDPNGVGFDHFAQADDAVLQCRMDLNGDSDFSDFAPDETVTYQFDGVLNVFTRDNGTGAQVILRNVTGLTFLYFDDVGNALVGTPLNAVDRARVRFVDLAIDGETEHGETVTYTSRIALRNI